MQARVEIVCWIAESKRPFAIVKDHGFKELMKTSRPEYRLPSPVTIAQDVKQVFVSTRSLVATKLKVILLTIHNRNLNFPILILKYEGTRWLPKLRNGRVDLPQWASIHCRDRTPRDTRER
jgi:hypothetical protein